MANSMRWIPVLAAGCVALAACGSPQPARPSASVPSSTNLMPTTAPSPKTVTTTESPAAAGTPTCVGLSICPPPSPDADGNPGCYYSDGWQGISSGAGIEVWYFHEPQNLSKPDKVTAIVRKKDGTSESQEANIDAGQQTHRFEFPTVDKSSVQEVLLSTSSGKCFVAGPGS
ncbi:hypothetical protein [Mycobacterium rhizamassiliense]|nr:hypothetical protein [Mycobacterium rhizamassiliense]